MLRLLLAPLFGALLAVLASCRTLDDAIAESTPYGIQLRERIDQWDRWCRAEKLGPYNDGSRSKADASCDFLFLKDKRWDPNADEFSRYAHSIKLPAPHDERRVSYQPGMGSRAFFDELCSREAGDWIFRSVVSIDGVRQVRVRQPPTRGDHPLVFTARELVVFGSDDELNWLLLAEPTSFSYHFIEHPTREANDVRFYRYFKNLDLLKQTEQVSSAEWRTYAHLRVPFVPSPNSRTDFSFVGRGIPRRELDEHGIAGTELIVVNQRTGEVLALVRRFFQLRPQPNSLGRLSKEVQQRGCKQHSPAVSVRQLLPLVLQPAK